MDDVVAVRIRVLKLVTEGGMAEGAVERAICRFGVGGEAEASKGGGGVEEDDGDDEILFVGLLIRAWGMARRAWV